MNSQGANKRGRGVLAVTQRSSTAFGKCSETGTRHGAYRFWIDWGTASESLRHHIYNNDAELQSKQGFPQLDHEKVSSWTLGYDERSETPSHCTWALRS